ncbi:hypothetical protein F0562_003605 [Nyssa sinensis]|uniref:Uncharacterized protein n=1 Tax=Nyssa sinensis TaxID=561372 RepID=A0A5J5BX70_9ASTE|nr:hypothetical protein F0562_003605 [Nyssa sinensis]
MLACPEAARFVLVTQAHLFKPSYPRSKEQLIGPSAIFFHQGGYHTRMRKLVQASLSLDLIRNLVPAIEAIAVSTLESWCDGRVIDTFHEMKKVFDPPVKFTFDVAVLSIYGELDSDYKEKLKRNYWTLDKGYNCFPINLPGTLYHKAFLARRRLSQIISEIISERRERRFAQKNLLSSLLNYKDENGQLLTNDQIGDNIIGVLFAAQDTTASVLTWVLKYIHDDPQLLGAIKVVMESMRMASIISFTFREAAEDVEYNGFLIPKGWKVLPLFRIIHHNPDFFTNPEKFDPSRFEPISTKAVKPPCTGDHCRTSPRLGKEVESLDMPFQFNHVNVSLRELTIDMLKVRSGKALALTSVLNLHVLLAEEDRIDAHFGHSDKNNNGVKDY